MFKHIVLAVLFGFFTALSNAQAIKRDAQKTYDQINLQNTSKANSNQKKKSGGIKKPKTLISDYKIITVENDTTFVDTTLTIKKDYNFNYLRKDNFELLQFSNIGQTYNNLSYNFNGKSLMPGFAAQAKHFNYMEVNDINYYRVPTPLTELFYKTAFEQGQLADTFFTVNTTPNFNFSIAYKGLRSLGKYQHVLTSSGNFRVTANYSSKNKRYNAKAHIVTQDILNQENGGIINEHVQFFENGTPEYLKRAIFEVNFEDAENILKGKRFYLNHSYSILRKKDSLTNNQISIAHILNFEDKFYSYSQGAANKYFGPAFVASNIDERTTLENFYNQLQLNISNTLLGQAQFYVSNTNYNYGYDKLIVLNGNTIPNRLKGDVAAIGGKYKNQYKGFNIMGEFGLNGAGNFTGNFIRGTASIKLKNGVFAGATINHNAQAPNYNTLLYQSKYINYNWQNNFSTIKTEQLAFFASYKKWVDLNIDYSVITDYVYFAKDETSAQVKPFQYSGTINYLRVKLENEVSLGKFSLHNTLMYQNAQNSKDVLNVPEIIARSSLYFSTHLFKKAMYLQTGITGSYFTSYYMNSYNPLLAEFYVQNEKQYGNYPVIDYFVNMKIRQARIFVKAEHINAAYTGYNYYTAPNYPYRDFAVRFGIVWNLFM